MPATFSTTKANNVRIGDEAIRDTMRINDDGSLRIPNVNREKHQGIWRCHRSRGRGQVEEVNAGSGGGVDVRTNQVLVKLSVSSSKPRQQQQQAKLNRKQKFYISLISFTWKH